LWLDSYTTQFACAQKTTANLAQENRTKQKSDEKNPPLPPKKLNWSQETVQSRVGNGIHGETKDSTFNVQQHQTSPSTSIVRFYLAIMQPFNGPLSGTTRVSQYQKGKTNLEFLEARDSEWQWHQLGHMQVILQLIKSKCLAILLYCLELCPLTKNDLNSLDFVVNRVFIKLFNTCDILIL